MKQEFLMNFLFALVENGYTVSKSYVNGERYRATDGQSKFEILSWKGSDIPHIGQVDTYSANGKWLHEPVDYREFQSKTNIYI